MSSSGSPNVSDLVRLLREGEAPLEIRRFAARGLLPLDRDDSIRAMVAVVLDEDPEVALEAQTALQGLPPEGLSASRSSGTRKSPTTPSPGSRAK